MRIMSADPKEIDTHNHFLERVEEALNSSPKKRAVFTIAELNNLDEREFEESKLPMLERQVSFISENFDAIHQIKGNDVVLIKSV